MRSSEIRRRIEDIEQKLMPIAFPNFGRMWETAWEMEQTMNMPLEIYIQQNGTKESYVTSMEESYERQSN